MAKLKLKKSIPVKTPKDFGVNLYIVKVMKGISESEDIKVYADMVEISENGDLMFIFVENDELEVTLALGANNWKYFYKANEDFQFPVSVDRWPGVAGVKTIEIPIPVDEKFIEKKIPVMDIFKEDGSCKFCNRIECTEDLEKEVEKEIEENTEEVEAEKEEKCE